MFIQLLQSNPWLYFSWLVIVMFSICLHEYAHAAMALKWGDSTAADQGHLTLNPMVQMGPASLVVMCVIGIAWGAVPVDTSRIRRPIGECMVALAGVIANIVLSFLAATIFVILVLMGGEEGAMNPMIPQFFMWAAEANALLFLFNLLPVPMLDGWAALAVYVPRMKRISREQVHNISWMIIILIVASGMIKRLWALASVIADSFVACWAFVLALIT